MSNHIVTYDITRKTPTGCCDSCIHKCSITNKKTREKVVFCELDTFEHIDIHKVIQCNQRTTYKQLDLVPMKAELIDD